MAKKKSRKLKTDPRMVQTILESANTPIDESTFAFMVGIYEKAARGELHGAHLPGRGEKPGYYLTNIPMNRGMMAVMRESGHLTDHQRKSITWRLMHFGEVLERAQKDPRFAQHIKPGEGGDHLLVSYAFQSAYGAVPFMFKRGQVICDFDELYRLAEQHPDAKE